MTTIGQPERTTQNRVIAMFRDELRIIDTQEAFSPAWVSRNQGRMPKMEYVMDGLRFCQWTGECKYEEFNQLRLYAIDNRMSNCVLH
jgi:hypothetical protein